MISYFFLPFPWKNVINEVEKLKLFYLLKINSPIYKTN
jgi:hypothetical protein